MVVSLNRPFWRCLFSVFLILPLSCEADCTKLIQSIAGESTRWFLDSKLSDGRLVISLLKHVPAFRQFSEKFLSQHFETLYGVEPVTSQDDAAEVMLKIMARLGAFRDSGVRDRFMSYMDAQLRRLEDDYKRRMERAYPNVDIWTASKDPFSVSIFGLSSQSIINQKVYDNLWRLIEGGDLVFESAPSVLPPKVFSVVSGESSVVRVELGLDKNPDRVVDILNASTEARTYFVDRLRRARLTTESTDSGMIYLDLMRALQAADRPQRFDDREFLAAVLDHLDVYLSRTQLGKVIATDRFFKVLASVELGNDFISESPREKKGLVAGILLPSGLLLTDQSPKSLPHSSDRIVASPEFKALDAFSRTTYVRPRQPLIQEGDDLSLSGIVLILELEEAILRFEDACAILSGFKDASWNSLLRSRAKAILNKWIEDSAQDPMESPLEVNESDFSRLKRGAWGRLLKIHLLNVLTVEFVDESLAVAATLSAFWPLDKSHTTLRSRELRDFRKIRGILIDRVEPAIHSMLGDPTISRQIELLDGSRMDSWNAFRREIAEIRQLPLD